MNNKNYILIFIILAVATGTYFLFTSDSKKTIDQSNEINYTKDGTQIVYCDENANRYNTQAEARAVGLTEAQFGTTYCPEYVAAQTGDYTDLTTIQAQEIAQARGDIFRVVEIDGQPQATTRDYQEGRINATVEDGLIIAYFIESTNPPAPESETTQAGSNDMILGMTVTEAEMYAQTNQIDFRVGTIDGVGMPVTADFRPGRITAELANDLVIGYTVE